MGRRPPGKADERPCQAEGAAPRGSDAGARGTSCTRRPEGVPGEARLRRSRLICPSGPGGSSTAPLPLPKCRQTPRPLMSPLCPPGKAGHHPPAPVGTADARTQGPCPARSRTTGTWRYVVVLLRETGTERGLRGPSGPGRVRLTARGSQAGVRGRARRQSPGDAGVGLSQADGRRAERQRMQARRRSRGDAATGRPASPVMTTSSPSSRNFLVCPFPSSMAFVPLHDSSSMEPKLSGSFVRGRGRRCHSDSPLGEPAGCSVARAQQGLGAPGRGGRPCASPGTRGTMMGRASRLAPCPCPLCSGRRKGQKTLPWAEGGHGSRAPPPGRVQPHTGAVPRPSPRRHTRPPVPAPLFGSERGKGAPSAPRHGGS